MEKTAGLEEKIEQLKVNLEYFPFMVIEMMRVNPELCISETAEIRRTAYQRWTLQLFEQVRNNFNSYLGIDTIKGLLEEAEQCYHEAKQIGFNDVSENIFKELLTEVAGSKDICFYAARGILAYTKGSKLNFCKDYIPTFENVAALSAEKEKKKILSLARRTAKRAKKQIKVPLIVHDIERLGNINELGYGLPLRKLEEIKKIVYRKAVFFYYKRAEELAESSPTISQKYLTIAHQNSKKLNKIFNS